MKTCLDRSCNLYTQHRYRVVYEFDDLRLTDENINRGCEGHVSLEKGSVFFGALSTIGTWFGGGLA